MTDHLNFGGENVIAVKVDNSHQANSRWYSGSGIYRNVWLTPAHEITRTRTATFSPNHGSDYDNFCMAYGNTAIEGYLYDFDRRYSQGGYLWSGFDYIGEPRPFSSITSKNAYYGAIDTAGFYKDMAYFYQSRWTSEPMVHVLPHWNWSPGETVAVYVYTNCNSVELSLNDVPLETKTMKPEHPRLEWQVPFEPGTLRAECTSGDAFDEVITAGDPAAIRLTVDRSEIRADGRDLAFITADIMDGSDNFVATADNKVAFSVSGPGEIVGVDNGSSPDTTSYKEHSRAAFSGKVLAIVQSTGEAGTITVTAKSNGLSSDDITVAAE